MEVFCDLSKTGATFILRNKGTDESRGFVLFISEHYVNNIACRRGLESYQHPRLVHILCVIEWV